MLVGLADTIMVGRVGVVPLAASAFVNAITHVPLVFGIGLLTAISVLASQAYGAQLREKAAEIWRHGVVIAVGAGLVTVAVLVALKAHLHRFGQSVEVVEASGTYLLLFGASTLPALVAHAGKLFSEALNRPWMPNFILLGGVALTVALNWLLIYGNWGFPALGLNGAGWSTLIARIVMMVAMLVFLHQSRPLKPYLPVRWNQPFATETFRKLITLGWPVGFQHLLEVSAFVFAAIMMGWISAAALAAHQIALNCAATTFMFSLGVAMAAAIRVGHACGSGQERRARRIGFIGIILCALVMTMFGLVFVIGRNLIPAWFVESPEVLVLASQMLLVAAAFQIADGVQIAGLSALRGLSDVKIPALIALLSYWIIAVPLGWFFTFRAGMGAIGIWIGLAIGLGVAAITLTWRFHLKTRTAD